MKFRFKLVKFSNFEIPSPNLADPSSCIAFILINFKIHYCFSLCFFKICQLLKKKIQL